MTEHGPANVRLKSRPSIAVVVPSYRRPHLLAACLDGLAVQEEPPDEVLVVYRDEDPKTGEVARTHPVRPIVVQARLPGYVAAVRAGAAFTTTEVVAFTDDDAVPRTDWVARLVAGMTIAPKAGALGGRDVLAHDPIADQSLVGVFGSFGRLNGNHHRGTGPRREVDVLKGVNMAFRSEALAVPDPGVLRGAGAETHMEVAMCVWAKRRGWRVWYDPLIVVDHEVGERVGHQRAHPSHAATCATAHNMALTTGAARGHLRQAAWLLLVGRTGNPGIARALAAVALSQPGQIRTLVPSIVGHAQGALRGLFGVADRMTTLGDLRAHATSYGKCVPSH